MKSLIEEGLKKLMSGLYTAESYISEDLESICDDTMKEYAETALESVSESLKKGQMLENEIQKTSILYWDVLTDISISVGSRWLSYKIDMPRTQLNSLILDWTNEFVEKYKDADWENVDYIILVDEFALQKMNEKKSKLCSNNNTESVEYKFKVRYVLGTEAVREYEEAVGEGKKWSVSSLCDCGSVVTGEFETQEELDAYEKGIADATGYLESEKMMTDKEWNEYLEEYFKDDDE